MQRGIAAPIIIVLFGLLAILVVSFSGLPQKIFSEDDVKGVATNQPVRNGFSVAVSSPSTWDLFEYLCEDATCGEDLEAGKRFATISGGATEEHEVVVTYSKEWDSYKYVKIYAKPGWGAFDNTFSISQHDAVGQINAELLEVEGIGVLLIPIDSISEVFVEDVVLLSNN